MKFIIQGDILDTENILSISKVYGNNCWSDYKFNYNDDSSIKDFRDSYPKDKDGSPQISHNYVRFEIKLLNNEEYLVNVYVKPENIQSGFWYQDEDYPDYLWEAVKKACDMRNQVYKLWSNNQSKLPVIK